MKKLVLVLFLFVASYSANAQGKVSSVQAKIDKSEKELLHKTKSTKSGTWLKNAALYADMAEVNIADFISQIPESQLFMMFGKPLNVDAPTTETLNDAVYTIYKYPSIDVYVNAEKTVSFFIETVNPMPDALEKALKSTLKAYEIDPRSKAKVLEILNRIITIYTTKADNYYNTGKYDLAAGEFYNAGVVSANPLLVSANPLLAEGSSDLLYFAVSSYIAANKLSDAKPAVDMLIERDYLKDGAVLYFKGVIENSLGNKDAAEAAYIKGVQLYPENSNILTSLISFYITNKEDPNKVIPFIKKAQEQNPTNSILFLAEGLAYDSMKDYANAIIAFNKASELDPSNFEIFYNLGLAHYRISENISKELLAIDYTQAELYNQKQKEIEEAQMLSLGALVDAHALNGEEPNTIELLRSIYFRQRNKSPEMMEQYNIFDAKSKK